MNKPCRTCKIYKNIKYFYKDKRCKDGHVNNCKECEKERTSKHRKENIEKVSKTNALWYQSNKEHSKSRSKQYNQLNRGKRNYYQAKYEAKKINATLSGFDNEIRKIYESCPKGWHVDHIIPLQGKAICGLHVPWNLQHLTAEENLKKSNKIMKNQDQKLLDQPLIDEIDGEGQE